MMQLFGIILAFSISLVCQSQAALRLEPGIYSSETTRITVGQTRTPEVLEIRAEGKHSPDFLLFYVNTSSLQAAKSEYGEWGFGRGKELRTSYFEEAGKGYFDAVGGGAFQSMWMKVRMIVDFQTGALLSMYGRYDIARWGLPNGWHSGPIKITFGEFSCDNLMRSIE